MVGWLRRTLTRYPLPDIAIYFQIKVTSPLTSSVSGTLKAVVQTLLAVAFFDEHMSFLLGLGSIITIGASFFYSRVRYHEMQMAKGLPLSADGKKPALA